MWVPVSAEEVEEAARSGALIETPSFDAKAELPQPRKNSDVAKDVAAMATDGGVLLYGVGEDDHGNPNKPQPISLAGAPERVSQVVSTSIAEVPFIVRPVDSAHHEAVARRCTSFSMKAATTPFRRIGSTAMSKRR